MSLSASQHPPDSSRALYLSLVRIKRDVLQRAVSLRQDSLMRKLGFADSSDDLEDLLNEGVIPGKTLPLQRALVRKSNIEATVDFLASEGGAMQLAEEEDEDAALNSPNSGVEKAQHFYAPEKLRAEALRMLQEREVLLCVQSWIEGYLADDGFISYHVPPLPTSLIENCLELGSHDALREALGVPLEVLGTTALPSSIFERLLQMQELEVDGRSLTVATGQAHPNMVELTLENGDNNVEADLAKVGEKLENVQEEIFNFSKQAMLRENGGDEAGARIGALVELKKACDAAQQSIL